MKKRKFKYPLVILDILGICVVLVLFALFHHVLPTGNDKEDAVKIKFTDSDIVSWKDKFIEHFTKDGSIEKTDTSYRSGDISIDIDIHSDGKLCYYLADIYISDISKFKTAFAKDTYGKSITDTTLNMAVKNDAILAVNGDYYGVRDRGIVIRNGLIYRRTKSHEVCVLYHDGTMKTYDFGELSVEEAMQNGAYQAWDFGPALLDDGEVINAFDTGIAGANPRSAIGYYEPGHYVLLLIDGRQEGYSEGMTLVDMSKLFHNLGCKAAYNLDGGRSAVMTFGDTIRNKPYKDGREVSDILYIAE